jgi:hypothetical protein
MDGYLFESGSWIWWLDNNTQKTQNISQNPKPTAFDRLLLLLGCCLANARIIQDFVGSIEIMGSTATYLMGFRIVY